jgi:hypothetical protein
VQWHSLHVHYYDDIDGLVVDGVQPLFDRIRDRVPTAYYIRHWKRGPHLRLNVHTDADTFDMVVRPAATDVLGDFLATRPSRAVVDPERWLPMHQRLAELEHEDGPLLPWRPDNSVHVVPYDRRLHVLGNELAADLLAEFYARTTDLAFVMTRHVRNGGQRLRLAFDLLVAVAQGLVAGGIRYGFVSYRSHAEAFLTAWPESTGQRGGWDRFYRTHAPALIRRVRDVVAALDGEPPAADPGSAAADPDSGRGSPAVALVRRWVDALRPFERRGYELVASGRLTIDPPSPGQPVREPSLTEVSPFHRALADNDWFEQRVRPSPGFAAYRLVLNYTYLQLTRLGVTPVERFLLCHLAANAVEDAYGCSALDVVRQTDGTPVASKGRS